MTTSDETSTKLDRSMIHAGEITIVMATRGRPEMVAEVLASLGGNTSRKDKVIFRIYVDEDDRGTRQAIESGRFPDPGFPVHWHIGPKTGGLGEMHQLMWKASGGFSEVYMISVDDARFDTPAWDETVREVYARHPDGVLLCFPHDPMTADAATYPMFGWGWLNTLGYIFPGYFPYWFDDMWANQIGQLIGRCAKLPIVLYPIRGKGRTKRMRNLPFWTRFFQLTLHERKQAAQKLIFTIHADNAEKRNAALSAMEAAAAKLASEQGSFSDVYAVFQEERHSDLNPEEREAFDPNYFKQEAKAVSKLMARAGELMKLGQYAEAMVFLDATQLSDIRIRQAHKLKIDCLRALGSHGEAETLERESIAAWPEMKTVRRIFRFLGMVANDGKRLLVGMIEKDKPKSGGH